jgi:hypothetical protein
MLVRLVTGCSFEDAERLCGNKVSDTTVRSRRDEWVASGIYDKLANEALLAYDKVIGIDGADVAVDGSLQTSPCGAEKTGKNPTDQSKLGSTWSILTDAKGIPIGWTIEGANRNDSILLEPTLEDAKTRGWLAQVRTIWLDRGYDSDAGPSASARQGRVAGTTAARRRERVGRRRLRIARGPNVVTQVGHQKPCSSSVPHAPW